VLYNQKISSVREDLDDAFLQMWFSGDMAAQVQVSRNHVAGYRNETWIYGDEGVIHVGHFQGEPLQVVFEAYGRRQAIERRTFALRDYGERGLLGDPTPVFMARFGSAYKAELAHYVEQCRSGALFSVDQTNGLQALEVAAAGTRSLRTQAEGVWVEYAICD
jgi:predicted dehydrogenase